MTLERSQHEEMIGIVSKHLDSLLQSKKLRNASASLMAGADAFFALKGWSR
ncbi:UNVERIFIED_CONTAM: hypothetical protein ABID98_002485 [Brevibacillus sp. OAP136]